MYVCVCVSSCLACVLSLAPPAPTPIAPSPLPNVRVHLSHFLWFDKKNAQFLIDFWLSLFSLHKTPPWKKFKLFDVLFKLLYV